MDRFGAWWAPGQTSQIYTSDGTSRRSLGVLRRPGAIVIVSFVKEATGREGGWNDLAAQLVSLAIMGRSSLIRMAVVAVPLASCGGEPTGISFELSCTVALDEIFDGAARDGIPALTNPEVVPAAAGCQRDRSTDVP